MALEPVFREAGLVELLDDLGQLLLECGCDGSCRHGLVPSGSSSLMRVKISSRTALNSPSRSSSPPAACEGSRNDRAGDASRPREDGAGLVGIVADGNDVVEGFAKVALQGLGALPGDVRAELRLSSPATRRSSALSNRQRRRGVPPPDLFPRLLLIHQTHPRHDRKSHTMIPTTTQ